MSFKTKLKISFNLVLWIIVLFCSVHFNTSIYLYYQAKGQISILLHLQSFDEYETESNANRELKEKLALIRIIKEYSVDSLDFKPTGNFNKIYNQNSQPSLWVISASEKFRIKPHYWTFPLVGDVSYKGFFEREKAITEQNHLISMGYDVDLRSVSAWSTLGWLNDPVLSNVLNKQKGSLCNLIFHELFHATYYAPSSVTYNENLASFIAHKSTLKFLAQDSLSLKVYLCSYNDNEKIDELIGVEKKYLSGFYDSIVNLDDEKRIILKLKRLNSICGKLDDLRLKDTGKIAALKKQIMQSKNAWFVDFEQYNSLQDSLEDIFNKNYNSDLRKMVQSLK